MKSTKKIALYRRLCSLSIGAVSAASLLCIPSNCQSVIRDSTPHASASSKPPRFEVASIRVVPERKSGLTSLSPWGQSYFRAENVTLELLTGMAFGVLRGHIVSAPDWFDSQQYEIEAKTEDDEPLSYERAKPLLQDLLAQRFHLVTHWQTEWERGYALMVVKDGSKLNASKGASGPRYIFKGKLQASAVSLDVLAGLLTQVVGQPVTNKTGISGDFDIKLDYASEDMMESSSPSIFTAVQEQLGLRLVPEKSEVRRLVVEHVDRIPAEN